MPFQGEFTHILVPRAMPWAKCMLAFQAVSTWGSLMNYHVPPAPEANSRRMPHESFFIESRVPQRPSLFHFLASLMRSNCDGEMCQFHFICLFIAHFQ